MKVLILHQHFKTPQTGGAIRSYYLAKALVDKGFEIVVIAAHNERKDKKELLEGITIHYLPVTYDNRFGFNRRVISFLRFLMKAVRAARHYRDADICYAISTPLTTGLAAWMIRRSHHIQYIFEVGDLWPDAPIQMGFLKSGWMQRGAYWMEKMIYRNASAIVALSEPIRDAIVKRTRNVRVHLLPNMADTAFFRPDEKQAALEEKFDVVGKFVVSYIGALGVANELHFLLDCAAAIQREELPVHFLICGDGAMVKDLKAYSERLALENVTFIPFQNRAGVREVMNVTDANFICYKPVPILETGSPNKYFDGLAGGKLTIINFGGWIRDEIERELCGVYVDPLQPARFLAKIAPFVINKDLLKSYQHAGRMLAERKYSRVELSEKFVRIVRG